MTDTMPAERTAENFKRLPMLLSRAEFKHWTGVTDEELSAMVAGGQIGLWRANKYAKYFKVDAARITGLEA